MISKLWSDRINLNRQVDALIAVVDKTTKKTQPTYREIPFFASNEILFENLPPRYVSTVPAASDLWAGQNQKIIPFENGGARVYIRELSFLASAVTTASLARSSGTDRFPPNFRWNFHTSITNRRYSERNVLCAGAGRNAGGSHIAFRDPLVVEPREVLNIEIELLSFGMSATQTVGVTSLVIGANISGYREGV